MGHGVVSWVVISGSLIAATIVLVQIVVVARKQAVFGTESHPSRDLSAFPLSGPDPSASVFGTESVRLDNRVDLKLTSAQPQVKEAGN